VVSSTEPRIEHFRREPDGWKIRDLRGQGTLRLEALNITIDLCELYAGVLTPAGAPSLTEPYSLGNRLDSSTSNFLILPSNQCTKFPVISIGRRKYWLHE